MKVQDHHKLPKVGHRSTSPADRERSSEIGAPPDLPGRAPGGPASHLGKFQTALLRRITPALTADLADYFGSIPHADLLKSVARRIVDRRVLHLIRM
jgi:hypothetical protein